ncbi:hypothetical protein [Xanthomonas albilineans]|uniref:hypothetical protein n=1 Tax=Xanthomonas albilineans TaxID=29447 RepID=UPI0018B05498
MATRPTTRCRQVIAARANEAEFILCVNQHGDHMGYRGHEVEGVKILHRGKLMSLTQQQWCWIKGWQALEPQMMGI